MLVSINQALQHAVSLVLVLVLLLVLEISWMVDLLFDYELHGSEYEHEHDLCHRMLNFTPIPLAAGANV